MSEATAAGSDPREKRTLRLCRPPGCRRRDKNSYGVGFYVDRDDGWHVARPTVAEMVARACGGVLVMWGTQPYSATEHGMIVCVLACGEVVACARLALQWQPLQQM
eukprot:1043812-Alexandrium_andersonii.AAC.1